MFKIGTAQKDITPPLPVLMGGSFRKYQSRELLDPIMASCIVADDDHERIAFVSCDLGSVSRDMVLSIREQVNSATGTPGDNIFITATHNHSGPTAQARRDNPFRDEDKTLEVERTRAKLAGDIAACIIEAHNDTVPARMGYGRGRFESGAFNRRFIMSNGRSRMHGGKNLERLKAEGPIDPEVQAVWFTDAEGRHLAVMVSYAAHPTNFYGQPILSADYPGVMRNVLQGALGEEVPVLYLQGACGNIMCDNPADPNSPRGMENAWRTGRALAGETLRIMGDNRADAEEARVSACSKVMTIPYRDVPPMPFEEARERWDYYKNHWDEFRSLDIEERGKIHSTLRLEGYKREGSGEETEVAALALGDVFFATNPAEFFVEFQLDIKNRFQNRKVIVTEQTNGRISYLPTRLACALGGYETIITRFNPGTGEFIRDACCEQLERLIGDQCVLPPGRRRNRANINLESNRLSDPRRQGSI